MFLEYEAEDLASFLQVAMLNGWDGYLLTQADYVNLFVSHDEYIDFYAAKSYLAEIREGLGVEGPAGEGESGPSVGDADNGTAGKKVNRGTVGEPGNSGR
jgi:hypothetical protein